MHQKDCLATPPKRLVKTSAPLGHATCGFRRGWIIRCTHLQFLLINLYLLIVWDPNKTENYIYILFIDKFHQPDYLWPIPSRSPVRIRRMLNITIHPHLVYLYHQELISIYLLVYYTETSEVFTCKPFLDKLWFNIW